MGLKTIRGALESGTTGPAPEIVCWPAQGEPSGIGIIIFPGGGYGGLAEHEGAGYARRLSSAGIACFVVEYRLGPQGFRHPAMLEDALAAISAVRSRAAEFGVNPDQLGVMGSSAGGHLAAHAMTAWRQYESAVPLRPDFGILCYPVITSQERFTHAGSIINLVGENAAPELLEAVSCERHVSAETPPCFLWHTGEDVDVPLENSLLYASALRERGVPFELHLYHQGRHGLGLETSFDWAAECLRWLEQTMQPRVPLRR
ncbi:alpha/beta hydrolase [Candidatus Sumerlaeota bacterium]|nr:alpha/beta hydrolase [Candidatus Sumerlaeota bacterium]